MATQLPPAPAPPAAARPAGAPAWSGQPAPYPPPPQAPVQQWPRQRGPRGVWILASVAALASMAALALGVIAVSKQPQAQQTTPAQAPAAAAPILFDEQADRALCEALPDLMRERNAADTAFQALPPAGSAQRNAAIPQYKNDVQDWAQRTQDVLAAHSAPDRYLTRTLQRYIDDKLLYAQNIYPNKTDPFDEATWNAGVVDYGGALGRCNQLGIGWQ